MDFKLDVQEPVDTDTEEGRKFRQEVRDFLDKELTDDVIRERALNRDLPYDTPPLVREFNRKLGARGWLSPQAPDWPEEYGGVERSEVERRVLAEEMTARGIGWGSGYGGIQGAVIIRRGSEEMKREFLPRIARGEISFALGYTEPNAGTDLASLEMRAVRDGDDYIINGQKVYSSFAHITTHHWLAVRTDPNVPKHRGISLFVVDFATPGITIRPLWTMSGDRTNEVFYDDVRVPARNLVGEENNGWSYIREALGVERIGMGGGVVGEGRRTILTDLIEYANETERGGKPLSEDPNVRQSLAQLAIETSIRRLFSYRTSWLMKKGDIPEVEAAMSKVWGNEFDQRMGHIGTQIMGLYGQLEAGSKWVPINGSVEHRHLFAVHLSYGGGSHELMRSLMATRGMGLPREPR
ncbi:MAG: acyl-CoA dehydrogenase family protein [Dehalococcoidales bacterium]|nr:acyl-CoA dehydrogenase family protein [Dehalococcoidales bacterium]